MARISTRAALLALALPWAGGAVAGNMELAPRQTASGSQSSGAGASVLSTVATVPRSVGLGTLNPSAVAFKPGTPLKVDTGVSGATVHGAESERLSVEAAPALKTEEAVQTPLVRETAAEVAPPAPDAAAETGVVRGRAAAKALATAGAATAPKAPALAVNFDGAAERGSWLDGPHFERLRAALSGSLGVGDGARSDRARRSLPGAELLPAREARESASPLGARGDAVPDPEREEPGRRGARKMPAGIKDPLQKSALVVPFSAGLLALLWSTFNPGGATMGLFQFAATFFPVTLLGLHFVIVGAFWGGRWWAYPNLSRKGQARFLDFFSALAVVYPPLALAGLAAWTASLFGALPAFLSGLFLPWTGIVAEAGRSNGVVLFLGVVAVIALAALAEVVFHFIWRDTAGTKLKSGVRGNLGQQLLRMRRSLPSPAGKR